MKRIFILSILSLFTSESYAQKDSLILNNGNVIVGEIKSMDRGVLQIETPYSDSDFRIELEGIDEIYSESRFLFTTTHGERFTGSFKTDKSNNKIIIKTDEGSEKQMLLEDLVYINGLDNGFLSRLTASIDMGYSLAKANNQQQFNTNLRLGYLHDYWYLNIYFNSLFSTQDDVANIQRNDAGIGFQYFLPKDWFLSGDLDFLSNTEQSLDLRTNARLGLGKYVIHSNRAYWSFSIGAAYNNEDFLLATSANPEVRDSSYIRQSAEGFLGTELNLFDIGDLNLLTNIMAYPSFTETDRWRADLRFDAVYDNFLLEDFYIRAGYTLNYDNQPAEEGKEIDYVFTTGFGWKW